MPFGKVTDGSGTMPKMEGSYVVEVIRIEDMEDGQFGARMRWVFEAVEDDGTVVSWDNGDAFEWYQQSGATLGPRSTARRWAEALLGRELKVGEDGETVTEQLIGRKARALVDTNELGFSRIVGLTPMRAKTARKRGAEDDSPF